jgi:hypothetical protein
MEIDGELFYCFVWNGDAKVGLTVAWLESEKI